jgi:hypothetical protein
VTVTPISKATRIILRRPETAPSRRPGTAEKTRGAQTMAYDRYTASNAAMLLIDHQIGTI